MITLHVLGAGGALPTPDRGPAAYWVDLDGLGLLIDPGPGALVRLVRQPGAPDSVDDVDMVLLSHLHLDHTADLAPLLFAQHSVLARREQPLLIAGPPGTASFLARLDELYGDWLAPRVRERQVRDVPAGETLELPGGSRALALPAHHPVETFASPGQGWLLTDRTGHRLAYTGDTGPSRAQADAIGDCHLLLVECSTPDDLAVDTHLSPAGVAELVRNTRPSRVVLTHMYEPVTVQAPERQIAAATGAPTVAARDGDVFVVPEPGVSTS